jgi:hypothetical protein
MKLLVRFNTTEDAIVPVAKNARVLVLNKLDMVVPPLHI